MIHTANECRDTFRMLESRAREGYDAYQEAANEIAEARRLGDISNSFSLRTLYEECVPDGREALREMESRRRQGNSVFMEAGGDAVTTAHFSNIIGQITYADMMTQFESPEFIGGDLLTQVPADTAQPVMLPGVSMVGDKAQLIGENEEYPEVAIGEQWVTLPRVDKKGFVLSLTEETIFEDKTGQVMEAFNRSVEFLAINREKNRLSTILGVTNTYSRNGGPVQNTYNDTHTQGAGDNLIATNPLLDRVSINASKNAFNLLTDPDTGEPIMLGRDLAIVVPDALEWTLDDLLDPDTEYQSTPSLGATALRLKRRNRAIFSGGRTYSPYSNQYVYTVGSSATAWWIGNFKKAFVERVVYPEQIQTQDRSSDMSFSRDIVTRIKCRYKAAMGVRDWRYVQKHTA